MKKTKISVIEPRILKGFRDYFPAEMIARQKMIDTIRKVYELYGFEPLETPALEYKETLLSCGEEASKEFYEFKDVEGNEVALRFDLTASLSRVIAQYKELPKPFKRYQIASVWRMDKPGPGRFREFIQFDIDTVGCESMIADAEIISATVFTLEALGMLNYKVRVNNRKILNSLMAFANIPEDTAKDVFRVLDKLDKQGLEAVKQELTTGRIDASGDRIPGLGLEENQVRCLEEFLSRGLINQTPTRKRRTEILGNVSQLFKDIPGAEEGISELRQIDECLSASGISEEKVVIDLSLARGLDYYTGPVFETIFLDATEYGSVFGGGRYDGLVKRFLSEEIPATGISIGVDRLFAALQKLGLVDLSSSTAQVLVTVMDQTYLKEYQKIAQELRQAGIKTELYTGMEKSLRKQLEYCDRKRIPIVIIAGSIEFEKGEISIKNMRIIGAGHELPSEIKERQAWLQARVGQRSVPRANMIKEIKEMLSKSC
ncbi:MAG: histidine--tRNA ligase [Candidatus Edwardsbacteria bacterium]